MLNSPLCTDNNSRTNFSKCATVYSHPESRHLFYLVTYNQQTYIPVKCSTNGLDIVHTNHTPVQVINGDRQGNDLTKILKPITLPPKNSKIVIR
jgi:hypothetical protein